MAEIARLTRLLLTGGRPPPASMVCLAQSNQEIWRVPTDDKPRRHPNRAEKRALKAAELAKFMHAVGRPAQKRAEPNEARPASRTRPPLARRRGGLMPRGC